MVTIGVDGPATQATRALPRPAVRARASEDIGRQGCALYVDQGDTALPAHPARCSMPPACRRSLHRAPPAHPRRRVPAPDRPLAARAPPDQEPARPSHRAPSATPPEPKGHPDEAPARHLAHLPALAPADPAQPGLGVRRAHPAALLPGPVRAAAQGRSPSPGVARAPPPTTCSCPACWSSWRCSARCSWASGSSRSCVPASSSGCA